MTELSLPSMNLVYDILQGMALLLIVALGIGFLVLAVLFIIDVTQTRQAIRRNYPVIGRFRYLFEHLGEFFRQYFFAQDREEMPFNRAQRSWIYRASKDLDNTIAFGSTRDITRLGSVLFVNHPYPVLDESNEPGLVLGPYCENPYYPSSFFNISAMSYGAISKVAVQALGKGAKEGGCWLNTGEGGLSPYHTESGCDLVFQIGTAKYGVRDSEGRLSDEKLRELADIEQLRMFEIKLSQGAKPGKGGILPARKVTAEVAQIRGIPAGQDSLSPNRHLDISSSADLLDMVEHIRSVTGKPVGFKSVIGSEDMVEDWCREIARRGVESAPDFITVDGCDGGTGAAPMALLDAVGLPLRESLPMVTDCLTRHGLRDRVRVIASGKLVNPTDVAWALCLGADFVNSARAFMFALGCIQALQCNRDTCPTGITTHNRKLQQGLNPKYKALRVASLARNMRHEVGLIAHSCGAGAPHLLNREHARIVQPNGRSVSLEKLYPLPSSNPSDSLHHG